LNFPLPEKTVRNNLCAHKLKTSRRSPSERSFSFFVFKSPPRYTIKRLETPATQYLLNNTVTFSNCTAIAINPHSLAATFNHQASFNKTYIAGQCLYQSTGSDVGAFGFVWTDDETLCGKAVCGVSNSNFVAELDVNDFGEAVGYDTPFAAYYR